MLKEGECYLDGAVNGWRGFAKNDSFSYPTEEVLPLIPVMEQ